jgi:hypothetical protein
MLWFPDSTLYDELTSPIALSSTLPMSNNYTKYDV